MRCALRTTLRPMAIADLSLALDWAAAEGWNPGLFDREPFLSADPSGFLLAEHDGRPAGSVAAVRYDDEFGFVGLYLVRNDLRGGRIGIELGRAALDHLGTRTIGIDGVVAKQRQYERQGFQRAYRTLRYEFGGGRLAPRIADSPAILVPLCSLGLDEFTAYDALAFPVRRSRFLEAWIRQPGTSALGVLRMGRLAGYGVLRPCRIGYKIGPLFADEPCLAEVLLEGLLASAPRSAVYLDVPEPNPAALAIAARYGMKPIFETARMYRGRAPKFDLGRIYGVTTLELG